jgi:putative Holliday junction resolvase
MPKEEAAFLAFDFGMKRIGVAVGQTITYTARPLPLMQATDGVPDWAQIKSLVSQWSISGCVVGLPLTLSGEEQPISLAARKFANRLKVRTGLPVFFSDERLTSQAARLQGIEGESIDSIAAQIILEDWLAHPTPEIP